MLYAQRERRFQASLPRIERRARNGKDQIDPHVRESQILGLADRPQRIIDAVPPAEQFQFAGVEGLHAEREPIDAATSQHREHLDAGLPWIALDREFPRVGPCRRNGLDEPGQQIHRQAGRAAAADVDRPHRRGRMMSSDFRQQGRDEPMHVPAGRRL
jgi:hypothetical protein